tara:strand:+ start:160 stop:696 length:537 start_codon:yes stop_codon:yes gene_type:complete
MALFGSARDASLIRHINRELINDFIDMEIIFYKLSLEETQSNMYDESDKKVYYHPIRINALILKEDKSYIGDDSGYDQSRTGEFSFLRDDLVDKNIIIEEGDVIEYDNEFYELDEVGSSQYFTGRNPSTDVGFVEGDRGEFGLSIRVTARGHVTRRNRLNIQEVRSGINKPNSIPRNL